MSPHDHEVDVLVAAWMKRLGLPQHGDIEATDAGIGWDEGADHGIRDVIVIDLAAAAAAQGSVRSVNADVERERAEWRRARFTIGAGAPDWMKRPRYTPDLVFHEWLLEGRLRDSREIVRALKQFARIRQCPWARRALAGFVDPESTVDTGGDVPYPLRNNYAFHSWQVGP